MLLNESLSKDMENKKLLKEQTDEVAGGVTPGHGHGPRNAKMAGVEKPGNRLEITGSSLEQSNVLAWDTTN